MIFHVNMRSFVKKEPKYKLYNFLIMNLIILCSNYTYYIPSKLYSFKVDNYIIKSFKSNKLFKNIMSPIEPH